MIYSFRCKQIATHIRLKYVCGYLLSINYYHLVEDTTYEELLLADEELSTDSLTEGSLTELEELDSIWLELDDSLLELDKLDDSVRLDSELDERLTLEELLVEALDELDSSSSSSSG